VKRLLLLALFPVAVFAAAPVDNFAPNLTATIAWAGNISNGEAIWDRIDALQLGADVVSTYPLKTYRNDAFHATLHLGGDWYPRFSALTRGALGPRLDWQHTFGPNDFAPVFTVELGADGVFTRESARRGVDGGLTLKLAQRISDTWHASVSERFDDDRAKASVFDNRGSEAAVEIAHDFTESTRWVVGGRWRDGDVVTYAQYDRPDLVAIAHHQATLETFNTPMTAYAAKARTATAKVALIQATSDQTAITVSYEYSRSRGTGLRFESQLIALSFVRQY
jgi:hypothetical protein